MKKKKQKARNTYCRPTVQVMAFEQCVMQDFSKVNPGTGSDLKPEEGTPENPKLAKRNDMWDFEEWSCDEDN